MKPQGVWRLLHTYHDVIHRRRCQTLRKNAFPILMICSSHERFC